MTESTDYQKIYQVSTLQALAMGYSRSVITVGELLRHGDTGLGTFEDVNGEMILLDGCCYRALDDGTVKEAEKDMGVPFASVTFFSSKAAVDINTIHDISTAHSISTTHDISTIHDIDELKRLMDLKIEERFGLNSMHVVRIDGDFEKICARSESAYRSHHISLKEILQKTQTEFFFEDISGSLVCLYYPDYMDGINAPGWHLHFISDDRKLGGHVFDLIMRNGTMKVNKISQIQIQIPTSPAFDTYSLKDASHDEIKEVEQGK